MSKFKLNDKTNKFCGSINFENIDNMADLKSKAFQLSTFLANYPQIDSFYLVCHDETETKHIHYMCLFKSQLRGGTLCNLLADSLGEDARAVNVDKLAYIGAHLKYMLHQDGESIKLNKKRYDIDDIISNDNKEIIEGYITSKSDDLTYDFLKRLVLSYSYEFQIMERLDLKLYHKYRYEIHYLYENRGQLMAMEELPF